MRLALWLLIPIHTRLISGYSISHKTQISNCSLPHTEQGPGGVVLVQSLRFASKTLRHLTFWNINDRLSTKQDLLIAKRTIQSWTLCLDSRVERERVRQRDIIIWRFLGRLYSKTQKRRPHNPAGRCRIAGFCIDAAETHVSSCLLMASLLCVEQSPALDQTNTDLQLFIQPWQRENRGQSAV